jgi:hypothetical protein
MKTIATLPGITWPQSVRQEHLAQNTYRMANNATIQITKYTTPSINDICNNFIAARTIEIKTNPKLVMP